MWKRKPEKTFLVMTPMRPQAPGAQWTSARPEAEGDALAETGFFDAAGEGKVFEDVHLLAFEASDLEVGGAAHHVEGAHADGVADGFGVGYLPWAGDPEGEGLEEAHEESLVPAEDDEGGHGDDVVGLGFDGVDEGAAEGVGGGT